MQPTIVARCGAPCQNMQPTIVGGSIGLCQIDSVYLREKVRSPGCSAAKYVCRQPLIHCLPTLGLDNCPNCMHEPLNQKKKRKKKKTDVLSMHITFHFVINAKTCSAATSVVQIILTIIVWSYRATLGRSCCMCPILHCFFFCGFFLGRWFWRRKDGKRKEERRHGINKVVNSAASYITVGRC